MAGANGFGNLVIDTAATLGFTLPSLEGGVFPFAATTFLAV
jgi:hypothetical protein